MIHDLHTQRGGEDDIHALAANVRTMQQMLERIESASSSISCSIERVPDNYLKARLLVAMTSV
jgi:hypothetical protein